MPEHLPVYEERRGWTARTIRGLVIVVVLDLALAVLFGFYRGWLGMIFVAILLAASVVVIDGGLRKPVALRMDQYGVTLTKSTARKPTLFVPWAELREVWVVRQNRGTYGFGVTTEDAPDEPRRYFPILDWHVDLDRVADTVAVYAPDTTIRNELPRPRTKV